MRLLKIRAAALITMILPLTCATAVDQIESVRLKAESGFSNAVRVTGLGPKSVQADRWRPVQTPDSEEKAPPLDPLIQIPKVFKILPKSLGPLIGSFSLADQLDAHRSLENKRLGFKNWDMSMASSNNFKILYLSFIQGNDRELYRLSSIKELINPGVRVLLDAWTIYNFAVTINIWDPVRGSRLDMSPIGNNDGMSYSIRTGEILDRVRQKSFVFKANGKEFWTLYGTDIDPAKNEPGNTRTLLFVHEAGLDSKAWPIADSALEVNVPLNIGLGDTNVSLLKTSDGRLEIHDGASLDTHGGEAKQLSRF